MKPAYVADFAPDTSVTTFLLVGEKELRATREGKPFLRLELSDRTGTIEARIWENVEYVLAAFDRDDIVKLQARVENYRNKTQLAIDKIRRADPKEIDLSDYFPHTTEDVELLYLRLCAHAATVSTPWLKRLLTSVIEDPAIVPRLKRAPAAKVMHHAFLGGLLEHMVSLCDLCRVVAGHYRELDADLLITGAILHDIGKLDELCYERAISYTTEGQLLGHIILELEQITKKMDAIDGFPGDLKTLIKHLLISHHGQYEFGSPKLPMFREALVLHYLDDLDSKMAAARAVLGVPGGDKEWTGYSSALQRRLLRLDLFRPAESISTAPATSPCVSSQQDQDLSSASAVGSNEAAPADVATTATQLSGQRPHINPGAPRTAPDETTAPNAQPARRSTQASLTETPESSTLDPSVL
jgi:3'-5' exoribonuclease